MSKLPPNRRLSNRFRVLLRLFALRMPINKLLLILLLLLGMQGDILQAQITIYQEDFSGYTPGAITGAGWSAAIFGNCDTSPGQWGVFGGQFVASDMEGTSCCPCVPGGTTNNCGDNSNVLAIGPIDISAYCNVSLSFTFSSSGSMECLSPGNTTCPANSANGCLGGHDQAYFVYSIDGGAPVEFGFYCGNILCSGGSAAGLFNGGTLTLAIVMGTQSPSESYIVDNILIEGFTAPVVAPSANAPCEGGDILLSETGGEAIAWNWSGPNGFGSGSQNPVITNANAAIHNGLYSVTVTNAAGCTSEGSVNVTVGPGPTLNLGPPVSVCQNDPPILLDAGPGYISYNWSDGAMGQTNSISTAIPMSNAPYSVTVTDAGGCTGVGSTNITINAAPSIINPGNQSACNSYVLPPIAGTDIPVTASYYSGPGGTGTAFPPGSIINTSTSLFIYAANGGCFDEESFFITINPSPDIFDPGDQSACAQYILPPIAGINLSGSEAYYTAPMGGGTALFPGSPVTTSGTIYLYDNNGGCTDEESFFVTINQSPDIFSPGDQSACAQYILPPIAGNNLSGSEAYYTAPMGGGIALFPGSPVTTSTTIYLYDNNGGCTDEEVILVTITPSPDINSIPDQQACGSYTLPPITGTNLTGLESYYDNLGGTGTQYFAGQVISSTTILYIFDGSGLCTDEEVFSITISQTPDVNSPGNQTVCDNYILPPITGTNLSGLEAYYDGPMGGGTQYFPGAIITSSTALFIYDNNGGCFDEESILITIDQTPDIFNPGDQDLCEAYTLPNITGTNLNGNEAYYDGSNGTGTSFSPGDVINSSMTLYIYGFSGLCTEEEIFNINITPAPQIDALADQTACDNYTLLPISGSNLSGNEAYYDAPNGAGTQYNPGDVINSNISLYLFDQSGTCSDEEIFSINITPAPQLNALADQTACDNYTLLPISGSNLSGNEAYYDAPNGAGTQYNPGDVINSNITLYLFDQSGTCSDEESFNINITPAPQLNAVADQAACDNYTLLPIAGSNLSGNEAYYDAPNGAGNQYNPGDIISSNITLYLFDQSGTCSDEESFNINITPAPQIDALANQQSCDNYTLSNITGINLSGNEAYYDAPNGAGTSYNPGDVINSNITLYLFDQSGSCTDEESFSINITPAPQLNALADQTACDNYTLLPITGSNLSGNEAYYDAPNGAGNQYNPGDIINSNITLYLFDQNGTCTDEENFSINITPAPQLNTFADQSACDNYTLLPITGSNLSGNEAYYDAPNGAGNQYNPGDIINANITLYLFDQSGSCTDEESFNINITPAPQVTPQANQQACDDFTLLNISGNNLSGNEAYYDAPNGAGNQYNPGDVINNSITLYIFDQSGTCTDEESFAITINPSPQLSAIGNQQACDTYLLPNINGTNLTGSEAYYTAPNGGGISYTPGDPITTTTILYVFDQNGLCSDEFSFSIDVSVAPNAGADNTVSVCEGTLLDLNTALSGADTGGSFNDDNGTGALAGNQFNTTGLAGNSYSFTYSLSGNGPCPEDDALITVNVVNSVDAGLDVSEPLCQDGLVDLTGLLDGADLGGVFSDNDGSGALSGSSLNTDLIDGTFSFTYTVGDGIICPTDDALLTLDIRQRPELNNPSDATACSSFILPTIAGNNLSGNEAYYDAPGGGGNQYNPGDAISGSTVIYIFDDNGICSDEARFQVFINAPVQAGANNSVSICRGGSLDLSTVLMGADIGGVFNDDDATGFLTGNLFNAQTINSGTYQFTYTVAGTNPCPDDQALITVDVVDAVTAGNDAAAQICAGESIDLSSVLNGADAGGSFSDDDASGALVGSLFNSTGLSGTYQFTYTVGDGNICPRDEAILNVELIQEPSLDLPTDVQACTAYLLPNITGNNLSGSQAYYDGPNGSGTIYLPGDVITSDLNLFVFDSNNNCTDEGSFAIDIQTAPNAGMDNSTAACVGSVIDLNTVLMGAELGGTFSDDDATGMLSGSQFNTMGLGSGAYQFTYTLSGAPNCPNDEAVLTINLSDAVSAGNDANTQLCAGELISLSTLLNGADAGGTFSDDDGSGALNGDLFDSEGLSGNYQFTYAVGDGTICPRDEAVITIELINLPQIDPIANVNACNEFLLPNISGTNLSGSQAYYDGPNGTGNSYQAGDLINSDVQLFLYDTNGNCPDEQSFNINIQAAPTAGLDNTTSACSGSVIDLNSVLTGADLGGTFSDDDATGMLSGSQFSTNGLVSGTYQFTYSISGAPNCPDDIAVLTITLSDAVSAGSDANAQLCAGEQISLSTLLNGADAGGNFSDDNNSGALSGDTFDSNGLSGTYQFTYAVGDGIICPRDEAVIIIELVNAPQIDLLADVSACDEFLLPSIAGTNLSGNQAYYDGPGGTGNSYQAGDLINSDIQLFLYDTNGNCPDEQSFNITINTAPEAGADNSVSVCEGSQLNLLNSLIGADAGGSFSDDDNTGALNGNTFNTLGLSGNTYQFTYTVSGSSPCPDDQAVIEVSVVNAVSAGNDNSLIACIGETINLFNLLDGADAGGSFSDDDNTGALAGGLLGTGGLSAGQYNFTYTIGDGITCPADDALFTITLQASPELNPINDLSACNEWVLPAILGTNLSAGVSYYDAPGGSGNTYPVGSIINSSISLFAFDSNGTCSDEQSFSINILAAPEAGADNSISICQGASYNLNDALFGADAGGVFSDDDNTGALSGAIVNTALLNPGSYNFTYTLTGTNPCPDASALINLQVVSAVSAGMDNTASICSDDQVDLNNLIQGGDVGGNFSDDDNSGALTGSLFDPNGLTGVFQFTYTIGDGVACPIDDALMTITVNATPQLDMLLDVVACDAYPLANISGMALSGNQAYYDAPNGLGNSYQPGDFISNSTTLYIYDNNGGCTDETSFNITIHQAPSFSDLMIECNASATSYTVSFSISGGDPSSYQVNNSSANINGTIFTSDPIPSGAPYAFLLDDGNQCGPALIDGTHLCACTSTNAGTMGPGPLRVCEDSPALIPHGGDEVLDVDDVLVFVLHDGDAVTIGNILLTSPTPDFNYDPVLSYGQPYFVTAIAASNDGNGNPDPLDPCYTQSPSVEVIFDEQILASIEGDAGICLGDSTLLTFSFNGSGLYTISYSDGNQSFLLSDISNGHTVLVGPSVTTTYTLVSVAANNSVCNGIFPVNSATVAVSQIAATASVLTDFDGFGTSCNGTSDGQASVTTTAGEAPFTYLWNTGEQTATISDLVAGDYEVTVTDALGCSTVAGVSLSEPPAAVLEAVGLSPQCFGDPSGNILISQISGGTGPFEYSLNGEFFSTIDTTPYSIPLLAEGQYNLQILDANDCLVEETVVIPAPPVNIVELGDDITIDLGETVRLTPNFNFSVQAYEWDSPIEFDCGICLSPTFQPIETVRLTLTAQDEEGCIVSDDISVFVEKKRNVYFPTAFSPNGDGNNEVFFINADPSSVVSIKSFQIFSRWGALVFGRTNIQPNDPNEGWDGTVDGKLMDPAVFVYYAEIEFLDGESIFFQGDVTLLK